MEKRETFSELLERLVMEYAKKHYPEDYQKLKQNSTTSPSRTTTLSINSR